MRGRDWRDENYDNNEFDGRDNNFDRMYDARQYNNDRNYPRYDRDNNLRRRDESYRQPEPNNQGYERDGYPAEPKKRSFFRGGVERRRKERTNMEADAANMASQFVILTPKSFSDIQGIIDNLKLHRALVVDLCRLNDDSIQRVMDYINGAIYALDGSIQRINPGVFILTPTGMGISVPIDYIKDKLERNKRK